VHTRNDGNSSRNALPPLAPRPSTGRCCPLQAPAIASTQAWIRRSADARRAPSVSAPDRRAEHVRHQDARHRRHRRPDRAAAQRRRRRRPHRRRQRQGSRGARARSAARPTANLSVDLQENYRLADKVAPHVDKIRYNPGHLHHHERDKPSRQGRWLAGVAREHDCALRIGVNCGSVAPEPRRIPATRSRSDRRSRAGTTATCSTSSASELRRLAQGLRSGQGDRGQTSASPPRARRAAAPRRHRSRHAARGHHQDPHRLRKAARRGIGDTLRVSLTLPNERKHEEIEVGHADPRRHRRRPLHLGRPRPLRAQHHLLPELLARRERGLHRISPPGTCAR
jgi:hypothetical protein